MIHIALLGTLVEILESFFYSHEKTVTDSVFEKTLALFTAMMYYISK